MTLIRTPALASALALALLLPLAASAAVPSTNVAWQPAAADADVERAFAQARAQNKPVLLYWGATWCPPCNQLKATFFNRQDFAQASRSFVAVHVDGDRPGAQKLGARFKVSGYPTVVLFKADGTEITRLPGEIDPERMMAALQLGMAGGRPVKDVLADVRAGKAVSAGEWRMLAFYSWETGDRSVAARAELPGLLAQLAVGSGAVADEDTATRLWLKAVAASSDSQGVKVDAALRQRVQRVLADPRLARRHADVVTGAAPEIVRALTDELSPEREALVADYAGVLRRLAADASLSRGDRLGAVIARVDLARMAQPADSVEVKLPTPLLDELRAHVGRDDREITDGYERQAVITASAYALARAGLWADSDALLKANLSKSHAPYYLMSQLGGNARKRGLAAEALGWYAQAFDTSVGPATRLQWGSSYLAALVELAPADAPRIEKTAATLLREAAADPGAFSERSARSLERASGKLLSWNADGKQAAVLRRLQAQLDRLCPQVDPADGQRASCEGLLKPKGGA